jgi:DNA-binding transcriptional ArsR family regulator
MLNIEIMGGALEQEQNQATRVAAILKCLAHPMRLMAVCHVLRGERFAQELSDHLATTKSNASQHLAALVEARILVREERGNRNFYRLADERIRDLIAFLEQCFCPQGGLTTKEVSHVGPDRSQSRQDRRRPRHGLPRPAARSEKGDRRGTGG